MRRVLLIEDNPADQRLFHLAVAGMDAPAEVVCVNDGDDALAYLHRELPPDLVVLDWRLIRTDGGETLKRIRASMPDVDMPVVIFSSSQFQPEVDLAKAFGARWFRKPMSTTEYFQVVSEMLAAPDSTG